MERPERWQSPPNIWANFKPLAREARHAPTPAEDRLWQALRGRSLGKRFRRQHAIGQFRVDFYCSASRLAIELDGSSHDGMAEYDAERTAMLEGRGIRVLRFQNREVIHALDSVLAAIEAALSA